MSYQIKIRHPLIRSILDGLDFYKITMGELVFCDFPEAEVTYEFKNRDNVPFPEGFSIELQNQIEMLGDLSLTRSEFNWLNTIKFLRPTYIEWLQGYRYQSKGVTVVQEGTGLKIRIKGNWYREIFWETTLMALISELYFLLTGVEKAREWEERIVTKAKLLADNGCHFIDFGTRRRFSYEVQDRVVEIMKQYKGFLGTSNPHLAHKHGVVAQGTFAHELPMAMQSLYGTRISTFKTLEHWANHYKGNLGIALTDTITTEGFLRDFSSYFAKLFDGARHDSNHPYKWGERMLQHYRDLNILTSNKRLVFSDNLKVAPPEQLMVGRSFNYVALDLHFRKWAQPIGGIGTYFTNDVMTEQQTAAGIKPLNMVIKLSSADFKVGAGEWPVVKLSDEPSKNSGTPEAIHHVKYEMGIA